MTVLFLTKYGRAGSSSRYRAYNYLPYLESHGWHATTEALLPDAYLNSLYTTGRMPMKEVARSVFHRFLTLRRLDLDSFDAIFVQYEIFPRLPFLMEQSVYRRHGHKILVDYDDATFASYESSTLLKDKIRRVMGGSRTVLVGNQYLESYARQYARDVVQLPVALDLSRYIHKTEYRIAGERPIVGWVGTPITSEYLLHAAEVFQLASKRVDYTLRCIGAPPGFSIPGVKVEAQPWSEATEAAEIRQFDVGVMPLPITSFTAGKCAFKLIQCMACGVASIGTALGANCELIHDGSNGLLASSYGEFAAKLSGLLEDADLRARLGREGRITVERRHCLDVTAPRFLDLLNRAAGRLVSSLRESACEPGLVER